MRKSSRGGTRSESRITCSSPYLSPPSQIRRVYRRLNTFLGRGRVLVLERGLTMNVKLLSTGWESMGRTGKKYFRVSVARDGRNMLWRGLRGRWSRSWWSRVIRRIEMCCGFWGCRGLICIRTLKRKNVWLGSTRTGRSKKTPNSWRRCQITGPTGKWSCPCSLRLSQSSKY